MTIHKPAKKKHPIYLGVFLDAASREKLLACVEPKHPKVFAEHLTLRFGIGEDMIPKDHLIGDKLTIECYGWAHDEKGQAVLCTNRGLEFLLAPEQIPHITISCSDDTTPKYSSELLANKESVKPFAVIVRLTGILDYFPRTTL